MEGDFRHPHYAPNDRCHEEPTQDLADIGVCHGLDHDEDQAQDEGQTYQAVHRARAGGLRDRRQDALVDVTAAIAEEFPVHGQAPADFMFLTNISDWPNRLDALA